jgi:hypothetical protein
MALMRRQDKAAPLSNPVLERGRKVGAQINHKAIIRNVPAYSIAVPDSNGRYIPLIEIGKVDSGGSGTTVTLDSAAQATRVDPTSDTDSDPLNERWLSSNSGSQKICYFDKSGTDESPYTTGKVYSESKAVSSVSGTDITLSGAFSDDPADEDIILPGGIDGANIWQEAVLLTREITTEECENKQNDFTVEAYGLGTVISYDNMPSELKQLYDWSVIPTYGTKNIQIDLDR